MYLLPAFQCCPPNDCRVLGRVRLADLNPCYINTRLNGLRSDCLVRFVDVKCIAFDVFSSTLCELFEGYIVYMSDFVKT